MRLWLRLVPAVLVSVVLVAGPASAQYKDMYGNKTNNGVNRGYVGSDSWFKSQQRSAAQHQALKSSMKKSGKNRKTSKKKKTTRSRAAKSKPVQRVQ